MMLIQRTTECVPQCWWSIFVVKRKMEMHTPVVLLPKHQHTQNTHRHKPSESYYYRFVDYGNASTCARLLINKQHTRKSQSTGGKRKTFIFV